MQQASTPLLQFCLGYGPVIIHQVCGMHGCNIQGSVSMQISQDTGKEIVRRGQEIYERAIRAQVEPEHKGKLLVINIETGEYEMDADDAAALDRAKARFGRAKTFTLRVGYPTAYRLGQRVQV